MAHCRDNKSGKIIVVLVLLMLGGVVVFCAGFWLGDRLDLLGKAPAHSEHPAEEPAVDRVTRWSCSMHPTVDLPEPGLCPICNMDLIPLKDAGELSGLRQLVVSDAARELMAVEVRPVERRFIPKAVRMVGKIDFDETKLSYITAWIPGRLDRLYVDYTGVPVAKGDHLAELYSPELLSAQEELIQAIATVKNVKGSESEFIKESARATVKAAREKLRLWGITSDQIANIEKSGKASDHITIYASSGGIVIHKNARAGMYVKEGAQIYTIADLSQVWVKLDAYESDLDWLRYGQKVSFTTVSYPGEVFYGTIAFIDPILNERTRTVKVRVNVANTDGRLKPAMFVKAQVRSEIDGGGKVRMVPELAGKWICPMHPSVIKGDSGPCDICEMPLVTVESLGYVADVQEDMEIPLVVPASAVFLTGTRAVVYVELSDTKIPTFEGRQIVPGPRVGDYYIVRSGLTEGEKVVVQGNFKIDSDLQIMARPSMMTPDAGLGGKKLPGVDNLSGLAAYQLENVIKAGQKVALSVREAQLDPVRAAFEVLATAVKAVEAKMPTGKAIQVWAELKMRLANDAVEGGQAKTMADARRIAGAMDTNLNLLQKMFALKPAGIPGRPKISNAFGRQLSEVFSHYYALRDALANDQYDPAPGAVRSMIVALKKVNTGVLVEQDYERFKAPHAQLQGVLADATIVKNMREMRASFEAISEAMITLAEAFGAVGDGPVYIHRCPMAFGNTGAQWLQADDKTLNPYFGSKMLRCGAVSRVIGPEDIWE